MPTVSGSIYYDPARNANSAAGVGIPVVLQNTVTLLRQIALTGVSRCIQFYQRPCGQLSHCRGYGLAGGVGQSRRLRRRHSG